jgi:hypothetical protein
MKKFVLTFLMLGLAAAAQASLLGPTQVAQGGNSNPDTEAGIVAGVVGHPVTFLGRLPTEDGEDPFGFIADGKISWTGIDNDDDPSSSVAWNLTGTGWQLDAVAVKAGSNFLNVYTVDDLQKLTSGGWQDILAPEGKGISHVSFFGSTAAVPEGGTTALLLGSSFALLGLIRRNRK